MCIRDRHGAVQRPAGDADPEREFRGLVGIEGDRDAAVPGAVSYTHLTLPTSDLV